jgi:hypothetical protein
MKEALSVSAAVRSRLLLSGISEDTAAPRDCCSCAAGYCADVFAICFVSSACGVQAALQGYMHSLNSSGYTSSSSSSSGRSKLGVTVASLSCNSSDGKPVPFAINISYLQQHAAAFAGVSVLGVSACKARAATADALLYFCSSSHHLTLLQPVVKGLMLPVVPQGSSNSINWDQAVLAFGGGVHASIVGGRFSDNLAGTLLVASQQAVLSIEGSTFLQNNVTFGGKCTAMCVMRASAQQCCCLLRHHSRQGAGASAPA